MSKPLEVPTAFPEDEGDISDAERGRRMADALRALAACGAFRDIEDPAAWEREVRRDRPLPGREE